MPLTIEMTQKSRELKAQGHDVISLSLGEPDFDTPDYIKEAAKKGIDENYTHYMPVAGFEDLRQGISAKFKRENNLDYSANEIVVSTGAKQSLINVIMALVDPGDEVIVPAPYWVSYVEQIGLMDGIPVVLPTSLETQFKISPSQLLLFLLHHLSSSFLSLSSFSSISSSTTTFIFSFSSLFLL